ncbi:hypothetical protein ACN4EK_22010 [Pantanalinema rosaneae CENA516]|uniref:hypothetical protein n=1 Tax=Pantanalinema rosaneae TaxID=1620701 RepID=UPI003D6DED4A
MESSSVFSVLVIAAFSMLVLVTGGIGYLTLAEWRDRRRQDREKREQQTPAKGSKKRR